MAGSAKSKGKNPAPTSRQRGSIETRPTDQQWVFIHAYIAHNFRVAPAAKEAQYSPDYARQLLQKNHIQREINKALDEQIGDLKALKRRVIRELAAIALVDHTDISRVVNRPMLTKDGVAVPGMSVPALEFTETDELDLPTRKAIAEMGQTADGIKIRTHDKTKALHLLMQHLGMLDRQGTADPREHAEAVRRALLGIEQTTGGQDAGASPDTEVD